MKGKVIRLKDTSALNSHYEWVVSWDPFKDYTSSWLQLIVTFLLLDRVKDKHSRRSRRKGQLSL